MSRFIFTHPTYPSFLRYVRCWVLSATWTVFLAGCFQSKFKNNHTVFCHFMLCANIHNSYETQRSYDAEPCQLSEIVLITWCRSRKTHEEMYTTCSSTSKITEFLLLHLFYYNRCILDWCLICWIEIEW